MQLTYENMMEMVKDYFDSLASIEGPQDEGKRLEFYAPDFKACRGDPAIIQNREEYVKHLCGHADKYRAYVSYQPAPSGIMIDERKKVATVIMHAEFKNPATGATIRPETFRITILELCLHENKIKLKSEMTTPIPAGYL